jgi:hypothetical protein
MAKIITSSTRYKLLTPTAYPQPVGTTIAVESDPLWREEYIHNTVYVRNPEGRTVSIYTSPDGEGTVAAGDGTWILEGSPLTASGHIVLFGKFAYIKAVISSPTTSNMSVEVTVISGGREVR